MSKIEQLDQIKKAKDEAEIHLKSIQNNIEQIDKEMSVLSPRKIELEKNIAFHKKANTVPLAHEYKKTKNELSKTKARLILITADRKRSIEAVSQIEEIIAKFNRDYEELNKDSENNILTVSFGGKRGKK